MARISSLLLKRDCLVAWPQDQLLTEAAHKAREEWQTQHSLPDAPPPAEPAVGPSLDQRPAEITTAGSSVEERRDQVEPEDRAEVSQRPAVKGSTPVAVRERGGAHCSSKAASVPRKPQPKPVTRPIPMSG